MRIPIGILLLILIGFGCKKDKFNTIPKISYKSVSPDFFRQDNINSTGAPKVTIHVTDAEGDLGFVANQDTALVFVKNLISQNIDSFPFPDIHSAGGKNFEADIEINLFSALDCRPSPPPRPRTDTTYFEIYIVDFAKNKSNVITTEDPVYFLCP
jgi:hypothetical protein